jgi:nucleoside-diphosphate-sugar epimerase
MSSLLIVGNRSKLGRAVGDRLRIEGWTVTTAGRTGADIYLDLSSAYQNPPALNTHDVVLLTAADFAGDHAEDLDRAQRVNALGALNVCRWASQLNAGHMVMVSSLSATYNRSDHYFGAYALTKRHGEELAQLYCNQVCLPLAIIRPTQIYNDDDALRKHQKLFYHIIDCAARGKDISIFGTHDARRNFIHLSDVAEIIARVILYRLVGIYDCPYPNSVTISQLAAIAQSVFGRGGQIRFLPNKDNLVDLPHKSGESLFKALNFQPTISLEDGIRRIKSSLREYLK